MSNTTNNVEERNKPLIERVGDTLSLLTPCVYCISSAEEWETRSRPEQPTTQVSLTSY